MDKAITIPIAHLTSVFDICGALLDAGGSDSLAPPAEILAWAATKKSGTVTAQDNWVLVKTRKGDTFYGFLFPVRLK